MSDSRAVIYARFSSDRQRDESIEDQVRECRAYAAEQGMEVVGVYTDRALSGTTADRPGFQQMISDARTGGWDCVVYKLDRFARDRYDSAVYKQRLKKYGTRVVSAKEAIPPTPEGIILEAVIEGYAEYYSRNLAQNVMRGMRGNALKCKANGVPVYGYDIAEDGTYTVNEEEARNVRDMFEMAASGKSVREISAHLGDRGARTRYGNPPSWEFVRLALRNEKYAGTYRFADVVVEGGMPAIVDRELFDRVQREKSMRPRKKAQKADYKLSGRAFCAECGKMMHGEKAKGKYYYYICRGHVRVRAQLLEQAVVDAVRESLTPEARRRLVEGMRAYIESGEEAKRSDEDRAALKRNRAAQTRLTAAIEQGVVLDGMAERAADLRREAAVLEARIGRADTLLDADAVAASLEWFADNGTDDDILRIFVNKVVVYADGTVGVVLNMRKGGSPELEEVKAKVEAVGAQSKLVGPAGFEPATKGL